MSENGLKYENWRAITESDYVTMFIKTWFAFVATLRELYPKENLEDIIGKGDGIFLNPYLNDFQNRYYYYNEINFVKDNILKVYKLGRKFTLENKKYNRFFSEDFYTVNKSYSWKQTTEDYELSLKYSHDTEISIHAKYLDKFLYCDNHPLIVSVKIDISDLISSKTLPTSLISKFIEDEAAFIEYIAQAVAERASLSFISQITNGNYNSKFKSKVLGYFNATTLAINAEITKALFLMRDSNISKEEILFTQLPCANFIYKVEDGDTIPEIDTYKWFLKFVYFMRNALFHEIIDPLDAFWQEIFKHSYLALKEILDGNINHFLEVNNVKNLIFDFAKDEILNKKEIYLPNFNENYNNGELNIIITDYILDYNTITAKATITMEYWYDEHKQKRMVSKCNIVINRYEMQPDIFKMQFIRLEDIE